MCSLLYDVHMTLRKTCSKCRTRLPLSEFAADGSKKLGVKSLCKACDRAKAKAYYAANREKRAEYFASRAEGVAADRAVLRQAAERIYGGVCEVCGSPDDLEFDHPDGDGKAHRAVESPSTMFRRIVATGSRLGDYNLRLLCGPHHKEFTAAQRASEARG